MVVGAFPIAKLSVLLIKQISKPIANIIKERAKANPFFRTYVCMPPAQFYNWCEVKAKMWILNLGKPVNIPVLSQEMAIELGANLLGESIIFSIGAGLLIIEYNRQSKKEAAKELKKEEEMKHINQTIIDLYFTVQKQQTQLKEMERMIYALDDNKPQTPPSKPPSPKGSSGPAPPTAPAGIRPLNMSYEEYYSTATNTPYPNEGLILQSLNYIQMDAFSSVFPKNNESVNTNTKLEDTKTQEKIISHKREQAFVSVALGTIEEDFRSLF